MSTSKNAKTLGRLTAALFASLVGLTALPFMADDVCPIDFRLYDMGMPRGAAHQAGIRRDCSLTTIGNQPAADQVIATFVGELFSTP